MNGTDLLKELERRLAKGKGVNSVTDAALARALGVTQPALATYKGKVLTPRQVVNLMEKFAKRAETKLMDDTVVPIVEFLELHPVETKQRKSWQLYSATDRDGKPHPYLAGIKQRLEQTHGIYIFHDSRGRAIYVGKAQRLTLWAEMTNAFNRDRGEVQSIKRVNHPTSKVEYKGLEEHNRTIAKVTVALHNIANYMSAYSVPDGLITKMEALIVRSFANDLLNVRMENF